VVKTKKNYIGKKFGSRTVIKQVEDYVTPGGKHQAKFLARCDCGIVSTGKIRYFKLYATCMRCAGKNRIKHVVSPGDKFGELTVEKDKYTSKKINRRKGTVRCCCSCGNITYVSPKDLLDGRRTGCKFCSKDKRIGANCYNWKGGRFKTKSGYVYVKIHGHPNLNSGGYIAEHRVVMEKHIGRYLTKKEIVHHINGIKDDNRLENLELWTRDHSDGQRVSDLTEFAIKHLTLYKPELLNEKALRDFESLNQEANVV